MAEDVNLASLRVDSRGVKEGIDESNKKLDEGGKKIEEFGESAEKTSDKIGGSGGLVSKIFDLQGGATAIISVFGIAGIASVMAGLTRTLLQNSEAFQALTASINDTFRAVVLSETAFEKLERKAEDAARAIGITTIAALRKNVDEAIVIREQLTQRVFLIQQDLLQGVPEGQEFIKKQELLDAQTDLLIVGERVKEIRNQIAAVQLIGAPVPAKGTIFDPEFVTLVIEGLGRVSAVFLKLEDESAFPFKLINAFPPALPEAIERAKREIDAIKGSVEGAAPLISSFITEFVDLNEKIETQREELTKLNRAWKSIDDTWKEVGETMVAVAPLITSFIEDIDEQEEASLKLQGTLQGVAVAGQAAGAIIAKALFEGGVKFKEAVVQIIKDVGRLMIIKGIESIAIGILASTPWGQALGLGPPQAYFKAGAFFLAVGAAAAAAAGALGGRSQGAGSAGGAGQEATVGGPFAPATNTQAFNVTVIVQGSLLGQTEDQLARQITTLIRNSVQDNA